MARIRSPTRARVLRIGGRPPITLGMAAALQPAARGVNVPAEA
jgi:hypothetical protein